MQRTSVGYGAFDSLAQLRDDLRKSYEAAKEIEQRDTTLTKSETANTLKETSGLFALGMEKLISPDGSIMEVKDAIARAEDAEREVAALRAEKARLQSTGHGHHSKLSATGSDADVEAFVAYAKELSELHDHLSLARAVFKAVLTKRLEDIRDDRLSQQDKRFTDPKSWDAKKGALERMLQSLRTKTAQLQLSAKTYLDEDEALFLEVMNLATEAGDHVRRGDAMREARDEKLKVFYAECAKLTGWCRQQLTNLEAMQEPDHVQEYCATLADNYPTMSNNFAVLFNSVQEYVQANLIPVHKALLEAEEVWLYLQVSTLERLSKTLFEIHPKSPLDVEVEKYASYPEHAAKFLQDLERYLAAQRSQQDELAELDSAHKECQEVLHTLSGEFAELPSEVHAFAQRAQALRLGYQCFREALLQRLTYISPAASTVVESKRRQEEFENCVRELKSWAAEASHGESWRDIYSKIVEIKQMIKSEQASLEGKRERAMASAQSR
ncbi:hypothetical protein CGC20_28940 [Leishmania donovani]|uniref:Uncharacterized protein n=3 Tax=Leishmania donovani species complex TaxID=38574 RepID=A4IDG3_LEIIN|nr:conserved hypothetical protein [Leishmania infantum JPCM5]TPP42246.1 hypothetical protein CGC20_28940 [Leishmania donovani]CAC9550012.1 hypothetical_protein_-_conserved [Leishmania infantum]CAM72894.1 conserved hypothetical protein [Leishmania infantum JPCM5]SUZ46573.1 hypothetical_protein_-_conserved [Leishmania infantum]|eukprot:XP_001469782.1 conserved hypothetical protein [Leishmania infantum JPCM5]